MGHEIDLLVNYPKANRDVFARSQQKTDEDRAIARKFDKEFFDGDRRNGYGGFTYNPRFWTPVVPTLKEHWDLKPNMSLLDIGCAKGFMLHDLLKAIPALSVSGIDVSKYAVENALETVKPFLQVADAKSLPFESNSFDVVIAINTIHNLDLSDCKTAIREIERVSRGNSFITVDAYNSAAEKERMFAWNLTAKTILSTDDWKQLFADLGYTGDYYWFIP